MQNIIIANRQIEILFTTKRFAGYGHYKVIVKLYCDGETKDFTATTTRLDLLEHADELETVEEKNAAYYSAVKNQIEEAVTEWVESI